MSDTPRPDSAPPPAGDKTSRTARSDAAVALQTQKGDAPPRITASGRGAMAEKILDIAFANDIKVREDPELVSFLSALEVDSEVPLEALAAVAEILTYLYRATGRADPAAPATETTS